MRRATERGIDAQTVSPELSAVVGEPVQQARVLQSARSIKLSGPASVETVHNRDVKAQHPSPSSAFKELLQTLHLWD